MVFQRICFGEQIGTFEVNNSNLKRSKVVNFDSFSVEFNKGIILAHLINIEKGLFISDKYNSSLLIKGFLCLNKILLLSSLVVKALLEVL